MWLDAADRNSILLTAGNVTQWNDKSGNSKNATAYGNITNPIGINGLPVMNYSGAANTYFLGSNTNSGTTLSAFSVFIMNSSSSAAARIIGLGVTGQPDFQNTLYTAAIIRRTTAIGAYRNSTELGNIAYTFGTACVFSSIYNGTNNTVFLNGTSGTTVATSGNFGYSNYIIGASFTEESTLLFNGVIGEVIVYNAGLTAVQRQTVEGYLAWKWGLQGSLPTTHPYYYFAPNSAGLGYPPALKIPAPIQSLQVSPSAFTFFNPKTVSGISLWLDAADSSSITTSGSTITQWRDKSGSGYIGTSTAGRNLTYAASIQNGLNVAQTATGQTLILSNVNLGPTISVFLLCYPLNQSSGTPFLEHGPNVNTNPGFFIHTQNASQIGMSNTSGSSSTGAYPNYTLANTWQLLEMVNPDPNASNQFSFYLNATFKFSITSITGSNITQSLYLNGRNNTDTLSYPSYVGELLIYSSALTNTTRQQVEGYLSWKWGIQSTLPSNHAYKNAPPGLTMPLPILTSRSFQQGAFSPKNISGNTLWLDGRDPLGTGITPSVGSTIGIWYDKSGNGKNGSGTAATYLSGGGLAFNGTSTYYLNSSTTYDLSKRSMFMVVKVNSYTQFAGLVCLIPTPSSGSDSGSTSGISVEVGNNFIRYYANGGGYFADLPNASMLTSAAIYNDNMDVRQGSQFLNGNQVAIPAANYTAGSASGYIIGARWQSGALSIPYVNANIYEVLLYTGPLTTNQRQSVEGYLAWKWGLQGSLPANHPFKNFAPPPN